ncbi:MAG: SpoIIE family protein phosphatase [Oscillospiraceae bacterium]|nr:SpoIIE family protein phosphatase [Oscillospiraceae bacterium]
MLQRMMAAGRRLRGLDAGRVMDGGSRFFIALSLGMARAFSGFAPFGVAFAAAAPDGLFGLVTAAGAILGYFFGLGFTASLKYAAAIVLVRWVYRVLRSSVNSDGRLFRPAVTLIAMASIGFVYAFDSGWKVVPLALFITESVTSAALVFFYDIAMSPWNEASDGNLGRLSHTVSTVLLAAAFCMGLSGIRLFGVLSIGGALAAAFVMVSAYKGGIGAGAAIGAAFGAALDLASGTVGIYTAIFSVSALVSGVFSKSGRLVFVLSYIAADALTVLWSFRASASLVPLYDCFAASVVVAMLPDAVLSRIGSVFPLRASGFGFRRAREYARRRLSLAGSAFGTLSDAAGEIVRTGGNLEDPSRVFDAAAEEVCRSCPRSTRCWQAEYQTTRDALGSVTHKLSDEGGIGAADLPPYFIDTCERADRLTAAINAEARSRRQRRQFSQRLVYMREAGLSQYGGLRELLDSLSRSLGEDVRVEPALEKRIIGLIGSRGVGVSAAALRLRGGRLRIELRGEALGELGRNGDWIEEISRLAGKPLRLSEFEPGVGRLVLCEKAPLSISFGAAKSGKGGGVSGDSCSGFLSDEGLFSLILADGMGTGPEAAKISGAVASALRLFLMAGVEPELSLSLIDNMMFLKNEGDTGTSTVDLFTVDSFTGDARFYKYGAAPSYVLREGRIKTVGSRLMPAGLSEEGGVRDRGRRMRLRDGDMIVFISDGMVSGSDDRRLRELISQYGGRDPKALSRLIMEKALETSSGEDDMTVISVSVSEV